METAPNSKASKRPDAEQQEVGTGRANDSLVAEIVVADTNDAADAAVAASSDEIGVFSTTVALCVCSFAHSYLLISVVTYSGFMVLHLMNGIAEDEAAQYAGMLASSFMAGRALTSIAWGQAADRYGRVWALQTSLALSGALSVAFGFSSSFTIAMVVRFLIGCSNGMISTVKTLVSEISTNESTEARTMGLVMGMWGWGFLMSPLISGLLADPIKQYPHAQWLVNTNDDGSSSNTVLIDYPFLLPNLVGALLCLFSMMLVGCFAYETLPLEQQNHTLGSDLRHVLVQCRRYLGGQRQSDFRPIVASEADTHEDDDDNDDNARGDDGAVDARKQSTISNATDNSSSMMSILSQKDTRDCLVLYWLFSFVSLSVDEAFPLFCLSHRAGFGIAEAEIGKILSSAGLVFAVAQYGVYAFVLAHCGGLTGSLKVGTLLSGPLMFLMPLSLVFNRHARSTLLVDASKVATNAARKLTWSAFVFLVILVAVHRTFSLVFASSISVALNRTVPTSRRGAMNGVSGLGGSVAKALGPAFAGVLVTCSTVWMGRYASMLIFGTLGVLGLLLTWITFLIVPRIQTSKQNLDKDMDIDNQERASLELQDRSLKT